MHAPGLSALYEALAHTVDRLGLDGFGVAVDDPELGHQAFAAGPDAPAAADALGADPLLRWIAVPPLAEPPTELDALRALAATALRLARAAPDADPESALEVLVRGLPHVTGVVRAGPVVEATVAAGHRGQVVERLAAADLPVRGAVVLRESDTGRARTFGERPRAELVAVRALPETGELEVHLRAGDQRTIGRRPLSGAGHAAAGATLDALAELGTRPPQAAWHVGWARTIDTTAAREFLVAVMIRHGADHTLYGLATGTSPVEAAARATLHACNRVTGWSPPD